MQHYISQHCRLYLYVLQGQLTMLSKPTSKKRLLLLSHAIILMILSCMLNTLLTCWISTEYNSTLHSKMYISKLILKYLFSWMAWLSSCQCTLAELILGIIFNACSPNFSYKLVSQGIQLFLLLQFILIIITYIKIHV